MHESALKELKAGGDGEGGEGAGGGSNGADHHPHSRGGRKSYMKTGSMEIFSDMMREVAGIEGSLPK